MASTSFFSQYRRFALGTVSASDFAYWVLSRADEMEPLLNRDEWDVYLDVEIVAAEFSGGNIDEAQLRKRLMEIAPKPILSVGTSGGLGRDKGESRRVG